MKGRIKSAGMSWSTGARRMVREWRWSVPHANGTVSGLAWSWRGALAAVQFHQQRLLAERARRQGVAS